MAVGVLHGRVAALFAALHALRKILVWLARLHHAGGVFKPSAWKQVFNKEGIKDLNGVPGWLERIRNTKGLAVFVDYAHTPDALENVLALLHGLKKGRLILVFGCGGDRDKTKRPVMGEIAARLADSAIITSDNPRSEAPSSIIEDIRRGMNGSNSYKVIENRKDAIFEAVRLTGRNDVLLVAGKGHEDYQTIGDKTFHFSDRETIEEALSVAP